MYSYADNDSGQVNYEQLATMQTGYFNPIVKHTFNALPHIYGSVRNTRKYKIPTSHHSSFKHDLANSNQIVSLSQLADLRKQKRDQQLQLRDWHRIKTEQSEWTGARKKQSLIEKKKRQLSQALSLEYEDGSRLDKRCKLRISPLQKSKFSNKKQKNLKKFRAKDNLMQLDLVPLTQQQRKYHLIGSGGDGQKPKSISRSRHRSELVLVQNQLFSGKICCSKAYKDVFNDCNSLTPCLNSHGKRKHSQYNLIQKKAPSYKLCARKSKHSTLHSPQKISVDRTHCCNCGKKKKTPASPSKQSEFQNKKKTRKMRNCGIQLTQNDTCFRGDKVQSLQPKCSFSMKKDNHKSGDLCSKFFLEEDASESEKNKIKKGKLPNNMSGISKFNSERIFSDQNNQEESIQASVRKALIKIWRNQAHQSQSSAKQRSSKGFPNKTLPKGQKSKDNPKLDSQGLFTIPEQHQYVDYLKDYTAISKELNIKSLVKSQNFKIIRHNGKVYFGQANQKSQMHGKGLAISSRSIVEGTYSKGKMMVGCQRNIDGVYVGQFVNGKRAGQGKFIWNNGQEYNGQWVQGIKQGHGIWKNLKGDVYEGNWVLNRQSGKGKLSTNNGVYEGDFKDFFKEGKGKEQFANGDKYNGQYCEGKPHGSGEYIWKNGSVYNGQFKNGLRHGKGILKEGADCTYKGHFQDDYKQGEGTQFYKEGEYFTGIFSKGKKVKGVLKNSEDQIISELEK